MGEFGETVPQGVPLFTEAALAHRIGAAAFGPDGEGSEPSREGLPHRWGTPVNEIGLGECFCVGEACEYEAAAMGLFFGEAVEGASGSAEGFADSGDEAEVFRGGLVDPGAALFEECVPFGLEAHR